MRIIDMLPDVRTIHSRAVSIRATLLKKKNDHLIGVEAYLDQEVKAWNKHYEKIGSPTRVSNREGLRSFWPTEWTPEDQAMLDAVEETVKTLDQFALPKKQVYGGVKP